MKTSIPLTLLANPDVALSNDILRSCVHCGICLSHCPTYQVRHDENDSPRGRIMLMRNMYESGSAPDDKTVEHLDRCLTCLACEAICPSGVQYSKLIGHGREYIEENYRRPWFDQLIRKALVTLIPNPKVFRLGLVAGKLAQPLRFMFRGRLRAMLEMTPRKKLPAASHWDKPQVFRAQGTRRARVCILTGCVQTVLDTRINEATIRLLQRNGVEVVVAKGAGCCGAPAEHMGLKDQAMPYAKANIMAWLNVEKDVGPLDAVVINASGCGTSVKAYGHMLRLDPEWRERASKVSTLARDVTEFLLTLGIIKPVKSSGLKVVYHSACSMQHGQRITHQPVQLLQDAGFGVLHVPDGYMCCGSAGVYNLLQPELAAELKQRKVHNINSLDADVVASGNIGCMTQLANELNLPFVHTVELLDWATGGPIPEAMRATTATPGLSTLRVETSQQPNLARQPLRLRQE